MLTMRGSPRRCCDGLTRRETLKAGALSTLGGFGLPQFLRESPVEVQELSLHRPTLQDVFIQLTGREIRDEEGTWLDTARALMRRRSSK